MNEILWTEKISMEDALDILEGMRNMYDGGNVYVALSMAIEALKNQAE